MGAPDPALFFVAKTSRQCQQGLLTPEEFAAKLTDYFAGDPDLPLRLAAEVAALVPPAARNLVRQRLDAALAPGHMRQAFHLGGRRTRTPDEEQAAAVRETARERAWAAALKPLLSESAL
jgi:hypothetical protein